VDGHFGQALAVDLDVRLGEAVNEAIVADAVIAAREVAQPVEGMPQEEAIAVPLDIEEEAEAISFEEKIEEMGFVKVPEEAAKEKRVGF